MVESLRNFIKYNLTAVFQIGANFNRFAHAENGVAREILFTGYGADHYGASQPAKTAA